MVLTIGPWNRDMYSEAITTPEVIGNQKHILVVEDNVALRFTLAEWLRLLNYIVYEAATADEASTLLASQMTIDFVITDIEMPGKLNGLGLVDHIQKTMPNLPVIVVSAHDFRHEIKEKGVVFFRKPYDLKVISAKIVSMLLQVSYTNSKTG